MGKRIIQQATFDESARASTSSAERYDGIKLEKLRQLEHRRIFFGLATPKLAVVVLVVGMFHEIFLGLVVALRSDISWWRHAPWAVIVVCRCLQMPACVLALLGVYRNRASQLIPFMLSQISLGSYADLHTYMHLVSKYRTSHVDDTQHGVFFSSPLLFLVVPILVYAALLIAFIYLMYHAIRFVNVARVVHELKSREAQGGPNQAFLV